MVDGLETAGHPLRRRPDVIGDIRAGGAEWEQREYPNRLERPRRSSTSRARPTDRRGGGPGIACGHRCTRRSFRAADAGVDVTHCHGIRDRLSSASHRPVRSPSNRCHGNSSATGYTQPTQRAASVVATRGTRPHRRAEAAMIALRGGHRTGCRFAWLGMLMRRVAARGWPGREHARCRPGHSRAGDKPVALGQEPVA